MDNLPDDTYFSLSLVSGAEKLLQSGKQEVEANDFASELLMPSHLFYKEAKGKRFSPNLIKELATKFQTSLTATVFKYLSLNLHPIFVALTQNEKVKYWKKSEGLNAWVLDINKFPPPPNSVATEYINGGYDFIYTLEEKAQEIRKSTWFDLGKYGEDSPFYEYCIPTKSYSSVLSVVWEK